MRRLLSAVCLAVGVVLAAGCEPRNEADPEDFDGELTPPPTPVPGSPAASFRPLFAPSASVVPFPTNLLFTGSTDGTLNIPVDDPTDLSDPQVALNALDGFSTIVPMSVRFSGAISAASVQTPGNVRVFEVSTTGAARAVTGVVAELAFGADFFAAVSSVDPNGTTLAIVPLRPLKAATTYLVALTNGIRSTDGDAAVADTTYRLGRLTTPVRNSDLEPLRQLINLQDAALNSVSAGLADSVVLAWTFTTQSIGAVLAQVRSQAASDADIGTAINPTRIGTTATLLTGAAGFADVHAGTLTVPYYLAAASGPNDAAPLSAVWQGAGGTHVTALNPVPVKTGNQTIPMLITLPNASSGRTRPDDGWPVVMYQHGITTDRSTLLTMADALAAAGFAAVAIDLPLHGLAPANPLRAATDAMGAQERTFDLDLVTPDSDGIGNAAGPDGVTDSSGTHLINLQSLLTSRDNLRQAIADLFAVRTQLATMDVDGGGADFDTANVRFLGWSLGAMVGTGFLALETDVGAAVLAMPGGGIAKLLDGSASFGPVITDGLADAGGPVRGSAESGADYESFLGAAQTVVDSADPLNYASTAAGLHNVMMFEVIGDGAGNAPDATIPNNVGTFPTFADTPAGVVVPSPTAGTDPLHRRMGLNQVTGTTLAATMGASAETTPLLRFSAGYHGSIADPSQDPRANATVFTIMQNAMATHFGSNGMGFDADPQDVPLPISSVVSDN